MRKWCAAVTMTVLFAMPVCAQEKANVGGEDAATGGETVGKGTGAAVAKGIARVAPSVFALPAMPRSKAFPATAGDEKTAPGRIVPKYEAAGMFDYVPFNPGDPFQSFNSFGGSGSFTYNASKFLGLTGELGGLSFQRDVNGNLLNGGMTTFLFGPRLNVRRFDYFVPFAEFLVGGAHAGAQITGTQSQSSFALAAGGGVDVMLAKNVAWRFAELDYFMTNFSGSAVGGNARHDNLRVGSGLVFRFGLPKAAPPPPPNHPPVAACSANPTSVYVGSGDVVAVHVTASDPDNDPLTYSYTATGGAVEGTGPDARWNLSGAAVGSYTVTAKVDDGRGGTATCAVDIKVEEKPNHPPVISCATDRSPIMPGEKTGITSTASDPDNDPLIYSYTATGGQISGSGAKVEFDSTGLQPGSYTVKCSVSDGRGGTADALTNVEVQVPPQVKQLELRLALHSIYFPTDQPTVARPDAGLLASQQKTLDTLASDFKQYLTYKPDAHLILEGHADKRGTAKYNEALSQRRVDRTKNYLVEKGVPAADLDTKAFGMQQNLDAEQVKQLVEQDPDLSAADKSKISQNLQTVVLANNRRVDVTLSTTGEQSVRRFPFNAADALNLISPKVEGAKKPAKAPAKKTTKP